MDEMLLHIRAEGIYSDLTGRHHGTSIEMCSSAQSKAALTLNKLV
jgi:hypothetical protein